MSKSSVALLAIAGFLAIAILTVWGTNNSLASKDQAVRAAISQVQNQQQRRADLLDNLVETVRGYASHESATLTAVVAARGGGGKSGGLINALSEAYPQLKADKSFRALQSQIEGTENRLAVARQDEIRRIQEYNTALAVFPASLLNRSFFGYQPRDEFVIDEADKARPKINFTTKG